MTPGDRYGSARALAADIEAWLAGQPVSAWPEPWWLRLRRSGRRHRTLVASIGSVALMAVVLGASCASWRPGDRRGSPRRCWRRWPRPIGWGARRRRRPTPARYEAALGAARRAAGILGSWEIEGLGPRVAATVASLEAGRDAALRAGASAPGTSGCGRRSTRPACRARRPSGGTASMPGRRSRPTGGPSASTASTSNPRRPARRRRGCTPAPSGSSWRRAGGLGLARATRPRPCCARSRGGPTRIPFERPSAGRPTGRIPRP